MSNAEVVGVDIGGTKTHVRSRATDGRISEAMSPTAAWRPREQQRDPRALLDLLTAHTKLTSETVVAIGAHGCDTRAQCDEFADGLSEQSEADFIVVNDAELLVPAAGLHEGIGLVAGTGSIVMGENKFHDMVSAGGWGWLLGDPGSAPALVREATKQVLGQADHGGPPDVLREVLCRAYGVETPLQLAYSLTAARSITHWASRASSVFDAANAGSRLAATVIDSQIDELVDQVDIVVRRHACGRRVVIGGGVVAGQPKYGEEIAERLESRLGLEAIVLTVDPVEGAIALADRRRASVQPSRDMHTVNDTSPRAGSTEQGGSAS